MHEAPRAPRVPHHILEPREAAPPSIQNSRRGWLVAPERNIVRATFGGILLVIALYLAVNAALLHVLSPAEMGASKLPAGDAALRVFGPRGDTFVTVLSLISVGAITNLYMMVSSRVG